VLKALFVLSLDLSWGKKGRVPCGPPPGGSRMFLSKDSPSVSDFQEPVSPANLARDTALCSIPPLADSSAPRLFLPRYPPPVPPLACNPKPLGALLLALSEFSGKEIRPVSPEAPLPLVFPFYLTSFFGGLV